MPELPEVESIRTSLLPHILGKTIADLRIEREGILSYQEDDGGMVTATETLCEQVRGLVVKGVTRRGKYLLMHLAPQAGDKTALICVMHMRMTGRLACLSGESFNHPESWPVHTHVIFLLEGASPTQPSEAATTMLFADVRRFGRLQLMTPEHFRAIKNGVRSLGPEPLSEDFSADHLAHAARHHGRLTVKALLLDQQVVAGIGNIYADEALFAAGVAPSRLCRSLRGHEVEALVAHVKRLLQRSVLSGGTTFRDYVDADGETGHFQSLLLVYHRAGRPCLCCGTTLQKATVAGRGTVWCPVCQPRRPQTKASLVEHTCRYQQVDQADGVS